VPLLLAQVLQGVGLLVLHDHHLLLLLLLVVGLLLLLLVVGIVVDVGGVGLLDDGHLLQTEQPRRRVVGSL
jgi:uncharacterized membrane protein